MIRRFFVLTAICRFQICIRLIMKNFFPAAGFPGTSLMPGSQSHFSFICKYLPTRLFCCLLIDLPFFCKKISPDFLCISVFPQDLCEIFPLAQPPLNIRPCDHSLRFYGFFFHFRGNLRKNNDREIFFHIRHSLCQNHLRSINGCRRKIRKNNCQKHQTISKKRIFFHKNTISVLFPNICSFAKNYYLLYTIAVP